MKEPKLPSTYSACMEIYNNFHIDKVQIPAKINGTSGKALKDIIKYLASISKDKSDEGIINAFQFVFQNYDLWSNFHKENIQLHQISSNFTNIIKNIKDGKKSTSKYDQSKYR